MASLWVESHGKAILVKGDTMPVKDFIKVKGGSWNRGLKCWIFPGSKKDKLISDLKECGLVKSVEDKTGASGSTAAAAPKASAPSAGNNGKAEVAGKKRAHSAESVDGDQVFELKDLVKATVSVFQGKSRVDLRKFYTDKDSGEEKPTPKGISLSPTEWEAAGTARPQIAKLIAEGSDSSLKVEGDVHVSLQSGSVDVRRFYVDKNDGEAKPGKKGIRLSVGQWEALKAAWSNISAALAGQASSGAASSSSPSKRKKTEKTKEASTSGAPDSSQMSAALAKLLKGRDLNSLSLKVVRAELEEALSLPEGSLNERKEEVKGIIADIINRA